MSILIYVNGKKEEYPEGTKVMELLKEKKVRPEVLTVEVNDEIVKREKYDTLTLKDDDRVEIIFFMGGGKK